MGYFEDRRIVVTGGAGFLGSLRQLATIEMGWRIR